MGTTKSFALLGFLPDTELRLKTLIQQNLTDTVEWVTATDSALEGVVINADFITSPQIQNYIRRSTANIVCCYNDDDGQRQAQRSQILGLNIQHHDATELQAWLSGLSGQTVVTPISTTSSSSAAQAEPVQPQEEPAPARRSFFSAVKPNATSSDNQEDDLDRLTLSTDYNELLSRLTTANGHYIVRYGNRAVWIDAPKNEAYLDFERDKIEGIENTKWASLSNFNPSKKARRLQLDLWLFETLWQSSLDFSDAVPDNGLFKLNRWPRPLCAHGRSEALRLAAFIQSSPATMSLLKNKTGYDETMVRRFIYAGLQSGQIQQSGTASAADMAREQEQKQVDQAKLGLLRRIRIKLGL
ncbi:MAG: hypothetical protein CR957_00210 [Gammaproteobacteria bacterium]|nr:MAG: hypothetical protein CR957_00210 [Gammaproteobacteria bacterium]